VPAIKTVEVRGRTIGGGRPIVCAPIVARDGLDLARQAEAMPGIGPDLVEWRADYLEAVEDLPATLGRLSELRSALADYPILFTCRSAQEGGARDIPGGRRLELIAAAASSGLVDLVDLELAAGEDAIRDILRASRRAGVGLVLSSHDFSGTPPAEVIAATFEREEELGADIAKVAVTPASPRDVLELLYATVEARENRARIPLVAISMTGLGLVSRIAAGVFGSAIAFGAGVEASAPGQIPVAELRAAIELLGGEG